MTSSHSYAPSLSRRTTFAVLLAVAAALGGAAPAMPLAAQGVVGGRVVSGATLAPLPGAQIQVVGTTLGALSGADGRFLITGVTGATVTLRVTLIGYGAEERTVPVGTTDLQIQLGESAIALDEIVVTGTPGRQQKRSIGNVVSTIHAADVVETQPVNSLQELINGRVAGAVVLPSTGQVGTGSRIRIRGASSFSLSNQPLLYVDGVRVNNDNTTGPTNQGFGSNSISRFNDINPDDIESIEIIKGPAAATLYGTEASNGVIQVITKRGREGATRFGLTVSQGAVSFADVEDRLWTNYGVVDGQVTTIDYDQLVDAWGGDVFRTGHQQQYDVNLRGGREGITFYAAAGFVNNEGAEPENFEKKYNLRGNMQIRPTEEIEAALSLGYVSGRTFLPLESGGGGLTWSTYFMSPEKLDTPRKGFWSGTPESYGELFDLFQDLNRFTGSVQLNHTPTSWFSHRLAVGQDQTREQNVELMNRNDEFVFFDSDADRGYKEVLDRNTEFTTVDYSGTFNIPLMDDRLTSSTSIGTQYYRNFTEFTFAYGEDFPVPGLTTIAAAAIQRGSEDFVENTTVGVFGQQQFGWNNRLFLTAGLRADDNSAFGENFDLVYYPKASGTWVISEEPFWNVGLLNTVRLRAAYGESGQQPGAFDAIQTFAPITGPGDVGVVTPNTLGNPNLGPERGKEIEAGFDVGLLNDRVGLEFTYYNKLTEDAILARQIAPSSGFAGVQFVNAGEIRNSGIELLVNAEPFRSDNFGWDMTFTLATNDSEVLELGDFTDEDFIAAGSFIQHRIGYPIGSWFEREVVSAELDADGDPINLMCIAGPDDSSIVPCSQASPVFQGRTSPDLEGAFNTALSYRGNLRLNVLVDFKTGYQKLDGNERVRCFFFDLCEASHFPERFDPALIASYENRIVDAIIHPADFAKLREVALSYTLPLDWSARMGADHARLTIAGRNLATWTEYPGLEPEATFHSGSRGGSFALWEQNVLPQLRQFVVTVDLGF